MKIKQQIQFIKRIQTDLQKEANHHRATKKDQVAAYCEDQAYALNEVLTTLHGAELMAKAIQIFISRDITFQPDGYNPNNDDHD